MTKQKKSIKEGKLPIELLQQLLTNTKKTTLSVIQGPQIGCDVAVLDYSEAILNAQDFYSSKAKIHIVFKTDPITFPTPDPGKYAVIVNANDVVTSGAIPFGFNATLLLPLGSTVADINTIQQGIECECKKQNIIILGGHTEVTSSVNTPIVSGAMIGFVPSDYYVTREISEGDVMLCLGWCAKEGVGIIASEGYDKLLPNLGKVLLDKLIL
ncbi:MAG: AIR synthase related protein, partial [Candidatus Heimdallarchaeota archaeon]